MLFICRQVIFEHRAVASAAVGIIFMRRQAVSGHCVSSGNLSYTLLPYTFLYRLSHLNLVESLSFVISLSEKLSWNYLLCILFSFTFFAINRFVLWRFIAIISHTIFFIFNSPGVGVPLLQKHRKRDLPSQHYIEPKLTRLLVFFCTLRFANIGHYFFKLWLKI